MVLEMFRRFIRTSILVQNFCFGILSKIANPVSQEISKNGHLARANDFIVMNVYPEHPEHEPRSQTNKVT